jgi:RNA polymerase sigma-70 factor (ECF subfamily)
MLAHFVQHVYTYAGVVLTHLPYSNKKRQEPFTFGKEIEQYMSSSQTTASANQKLHDLDGADEDEAFGAFYDRWSGAVYGLAFNILRDQAQAEAVTEEAFCRAWRFTRRAEDDARTSGLRVLRLTHGLAVADLRRVRDDAEIRMPAAAEATMTTGTRSQTSSARPLRKSAIELAFWDGLTCREIAAATGATVAQALDDLRAGLRGQNGSIALSARRLDGDSSSPTSR